MFDFSGNCEYILARGEMTPTDSFSISIKNVPCGTSAVTCSKAATIIVGTGAHREVVQIVKGQETVLGPSYKRITTRDVGLLVSFEVFDLGLVVQWDKGNKLYVRLKPKWRGLVTGLCGNFNSDNQDDFKTPSALIEAAPDIFGDSWKVHNYCPKASTLQVVVVVVVVVVTNSSVLQDTCSLHPHRKQWSTKKCGILKSEVFRRCRAEVPLQPYFAQCVHDTCGCNVGGDCECLCTAVSAYAQACLEAGVPVAWRTPAVCGQDRE